MKAGMRANSCDEGQALPEPVSTTPVKACRYVKHTFPSVDYMEGGKETPISPWWLLNRQLKSDIETIFCDNRLPINRKLILNRCHFEQSEESPLLSTKDSSVVKLPQNDILQVIFYQYLIAGLITVVFLRVLSVPSASRSTIAVAVRVRPARTIGSSWSVPAAAVTICAIHV